MGHLLSQKKKVHWDTPTLHRTARTLDTPPRQNDDFFDTKNTTVVSCLWSTSSLDNQPKLKGVNS